MYYLKGTGHLETEGETIPFRPGSIILVPPNMDHGSVSGEEFVNISISGDFDRLFWMNTITIQQDNASENGRQLAQLILDNQHQSPEYVAALCSAYAHFLLQNTKHEGRLHQAVSEIIAQTTRNYFDPDFNVTGVLDRCGYAQDYIRAEFKKAVGMAPVKFLTKVRIDHAMKMFEIYGSSMSVSQAAEACGFMDMAYFYKCFKQRTGLSPTAFRDQNLQGTVR